MKKYVAFNYRKEGDPLGSDLQGCWKEFEDLASAGDWMKNRIGKTKTSPQGHLCFDRDNGLDNIRSLYTDMFFPRSLRLAVGAYLNYRGFRLPGKK